MQNSHKWHFYLVMSKKCCIFAVILTQSSTTMTFIKELSKRRSNYAHPDQATTQTKSLDQLSSGIYTEDERFIYELLQNAVDSFSPANGSLDINIVAQEGYLVFMHNGEAFSKRDVEGLCDVGNGNKMKDIQKIGYKGIGFKSVFRASNCVHIQSGDFCFKFDKAVWNNYWDSNWKDEYGEKDLDKNYLMPWQIIPIETTAPIQIDTTGYNVVTYIQTKNLAELSESVKTLLRTSQFLLFLTAKNVRMTYVESGVPQQIIEKQTFDNEISLLVNGKEESRWLYHMIPNVPINDEELRLRIAEDQKTPDKLKIDEHGKTLSVNTFDIAFAVQIENKDGERIVKTADNPVMYTYLPTSFKFGDEGFPFLVNANFITDAGREQLIKDSEWNKLLISKIPELYLKWVATFSREIKNYYDVLPKKSYGVSDKLRLAYDTAAKSAIETIPFIPSLRTNELLKSNDAFIDRIGLADIMKHQLLFAHIDRIYNRTFEQESNIVANQGVTILKQYGVFVFDQSKFKAFFDDKEAINGISSDEDVKLIKLLHECCLLNEDSDFEQQLQEIPFLLNNHNQLALPCQLCTHVLEDADEINADVQTINADIYNQLSQYDLDWLKKLGLSEPSDTSIIDTGRLFEENYVTLNNAIQIGRYIFELYLRGKLDEAQLDKLNGLRVLSKNGTLIQVGNSYLSKEYLPDLQIEGIVHDDMFISPDYIYENDSISQWKLFLRHIGIADKITLTQKSISRNSATTIYEWAQEYWSANRTQPNTYNGVWLNPINRYTLYIYSLFEHVTKIEFARIFWKTILNDEFGRVRNDKGYTSFAYQDKTDLDDNFFEWCIANIPIVPTTLGTLELANNVYTNEIFEECQAYLPIIDIDSSITITNEWLNILQLKTILGVSDCLLVLTKISQKEDELNNEDKKLLTKLYEFLTSQISRLNNSDYELIKQWALSNKILALDNKFYLPSELSYTTLEGFNSNKQIYVGRIEDKLRLVELLRLFGVKIYTEENIEALCDIKQEDYKISTRLLSLVSILALLASEGKNQEHFEIKRQELQNKLSQTTFYSCTSIQLAFRDSVARADRQTYSANGNFYFVGDISPAKIEPLLSPLCTYLGIKHKEREFLVLMTEPSYDAIVEFLKEKEYNTDWLASNEVASLVQTTDAEVGVELDNGLDHDRQLADSNEAKSLVLAHLESKGFDISNVDRTQSTIHGLKKEGMEYPLVVKSYKDKRYPLRLNPIEWHQLFKPNSMLWLHLGRGVIAPIKAYELFTYQDKLTLSFDTINILMDDRVDKIMQVMRYFNNVHLNLSTLNPDTKRADNLNEYAFHSNNLANSDLNNDTEVQF